MLYIAEGCGVTEGRLVLSAQLRALGQSQRSIHDRADAEEVRLHPHGVLGKRLQANQTSFRSSTNMWYFYFQY